MQFERNGGSIMRTTQPLRVLKKLRRTVMIDSRDRDVTKYVRVVGGAPASDPGDFVVYLPRAIQNVTKIRLRSAILQKPVDKMDVSDNALYTASVLTGDTYVLMGIEGLNRCDETAPGGDRSGHVDSVFAKLPYSDTTLYYNDRSYEENETVYNPPIATLDRLHITLRRAHQSSATSNIAAPIIFGAAENSFVFEIEYIDNVFEDVGAVETQLSAVNYIR